MRTLRSTAIKWLWDLRSFEWNYGSPYPPIEIEHRLRDSILNGGLLFGHEQGLDGTVSSNAFSLHYVDAGEGRSAHLNGVFHSSGDGSSVRVQCADSTEERRMFMVVVVLIASIMTFGLGYQKFGPVVLLAPPLYWVAQLVILRSIFNQDLPITLRALEQLLDLQPINA
jgi:hypothetical protein